MTMATSLARDSGALSKSKLNRPERLRTDVNVNLILYMTFLENQLRNQSKKAFITPFWMLFQ